MSTNLFPPPPPPPFPPPPIRIWLNSADIPLTTGGWTGRFSMASFTLNGKGYLAAGGVMDASSRQSTSTDVLCYDPTTGTWSQKAAFPGSARTGTASFAINNYGYICTGVAANFSTPTTENWRYDPNQNWWNRKAPFPGYARSYAVGVALNGKGYLGTGAPTSGGADGGLLDWWQYDPVADSWTAKRNMPGTIGRWGAVAFANDHTIGQYVYVGGGLYGLGDNPPQPKNDFYSLYYW
jgi:hypothetical protein